MYKVERKNGKEGWRLCGSYPDEQTATNRVDSLSDRNPDTKYRVKDKDGSVVYSV